MVAYTKTRLFRKPVEELVDPILVIELWDKNKFRKDRLLGDMELDLLDFIGSSSANYVHLNLFCRRRWLPGRCWSLLDKEEKATSEVSEVLHEQRVSLPLLHLLFRDKVSLRTEKDQEEAFPEASCEWNTIRFIMFETLSAFCRTRRIRRDCKSIRSSQLVRMVADVDG